MYSFLAITGHQLIAWALGLTATIVLLDTDSGFVRDHPPLVRRCLGALAGPVALIGLVALCLTAPLLYTLLLVGPFVGLAAAYSGCWMRLVNAAKRRGLGRDALIVGPVSLLFLMLSIGPQDWSGGVVMAAYGASAALLGGLTALFIIALTSRVKDEFEVEGNPFGVPARVTAVGLGLTVLATLDMLQGLSDAMPMGWVAAWLLLSLAVPAGLMALGHGLFHKGIWPALQRPVWAIALVSALAGQAAIHVLTLLYPGLIPPSGL